jgi:hypothetical protein
MTPWLRKLALTAHVTFSIGWIGAVVGFLALAIAGLTSPNEQMVRSAYLSMDLIGWMVIVPLCLASLLSGVIQGLFTPWGLLRHWWVLVKLSVTVPLTILLMVHMQPTRRLAAVAAESAISGAQLHPMQLQLAVDAAAALLALLAVVALAIYKPRGVTKYRARKLPGKGIGDSPEPSAPTPMWVRMFVVAALVSLIAVRTLSGAGGHHSLGHDLGAMSSAPTSQQETANR